MSEQDRIRLAEVVWGYTECECVGGQLVGYSPAAQNAMWKVDHRKSLLPDPYTDANDDYAVLEWMRKVTGRYEPAYERTMPAINWKLFCENLHSRGLYDIGDYARAALMVLDND